MSTTPLPVAGGTARSPDIRHALDWRELHAGLDEAAHRGVPLLCLAEPHWTTGAQRLALYLGDDEATRDLVASSFVPILVDPIERPDVAARLRWAATSLTGTAGPPLLALLTPKGSPFLAYCSLWPEGKGAYPSLRSLLQSVAELDRSRRASIETEALLLQERARPRPSSAPRYTAWQSVRDAVDVHAGGLAEIPKHPRVALLWALLDEAVHPPVREHLLRTLDGLLRGGIRDLLSGRFHRASRDERWIVPHFEMLVPMNAGLAAVLTRAGRQLERPQFVEAAQGAARFAARALDEGVMAIAADTTYATWTPRQFQEALDPAEIQALGLHVHMTRDPSAHVLYRALEPDAMGGYADEEPSVLAERIRSGIERLALVRAERPAPEVVRVDAPSWHAETLRWLLEARGAGLDLERTPLERHLRDLQARARDPHAGYGRCGWYWLEDQVAMSAAFLAAADDDADWLDPAIEGAQLVLDHYLDPATGALAEAPRGARGARAGRPSQDVVDHVVRAAAPAAVDLFDALAARRGRGRLATRFATAAERIERYHRQAQHALSGCVLEGRAA
jgi:uncharacterized protein YyaL (SSP411 family)